MKYVKSQRNYGFLITKELIFGFQILDLKGHFSASLKKIKNQLRKIKLLQQIYFQENSDTELYYSHLTNSKT